MSLAILLVGPFELAGIGLAIAVGSWAEVAFLLAVLHRRIGAFRPTEVIGPGVVALAAALAASVAALAARAVLLDVVGPTTSRPAILVVLVLATSLAGLVYLGLSRAVRFPELGTIVRLMSDALRRPARP